MLPRETNSSRITHLLSHRHRALHRTAHTGTTENNTQQTQEQFIARSTHKAAQARSTQGTGETSTAHSTQEHKAQHIKEQESTACLIYCHTGASGISSTHAPDQLTTPLVCNKVISDYLCSFARLIAPENQKHWQRNCLFDSKL